MLVGAVIGWLLDRWLGHFAVGADRVSAARLRRRRAECDARGRRRASNGRQDLASDLATGRRTIMAVDPIHQFQIHNLVPDRQDRHTEIAFTNSAALHAARGGRLTAVSGRSAPPGAAWCPARLQSAAELSYEFVATTVRTTAGTEGMRFFPFVFTLFMFILAVNMIGLIPYAFTVTSHIIITAALALLGVPHRADLRLLRARPALLQPVRAEGRADLHPAADRLHRGAVVPVAADLAQRASVRQHAGRPHHAEGVRQLHHPARRRARRRSAGSAACCRSA